ncbi:MAG TPA: hypothetical protein VF103_11895 [Polyangiaceae bacterium]
MKQNTLFFVLPVFSLLGCSGSQPGPGTEEDKLRTEPAFCAEWAKAACNEDVVNACNGTRTECLATQKSACQVLVPPGYQSKYAEDCIDAVKDAYKDAELTAEELDVVLKLGGACKTLTDGGKEEGDSCTSSTECNGVDGFECVVKPGDAEGTCQIPVIVGGGRRCSAAESVCEPDFYCDGTNCVARLPELEACNGDVCEAGLRCEVGSGALEGACVLQLENGDSCVADEQCQSGVCIGATAKVCASNVVLTVESSLCDTLR